MADDEKEKGSQNRGRHQKYQGQPGIDEEGGDDGRGHHHRGAEARPQAGGDGILNGCHVAGHAGDQGGGAEMVCIRKGELLELGKFSLAQLCPQALAAAGRKYGCALPEHQGHEGEGAHLKAPHDNIAGVAVGHTHVDDGGHDEGDDKLKYSLGHDAEDGQDTVLFVGLYIGKKFLHDENPPGA